MENKIEKGMAYLDGECIGEVTNINTVFNTEPTAEEIALDRKYTDIQTVTSIICSMLNFDEKMYNEKFRYKCEDGIVWSYIDEDHIISDEDGTYSICLRMEDINKPLELFISVMDGLGLHNIAVWSIDSNKEKTVNEVHKCCSENDPRFENIGVFLNLGVKIFQRVLNLEDEV